MDKSAKIGANLRFAIVNFRQRQSAEAAMASLHRTVVPALGRNLIKMKYRVDDFLS